MKASNWIESENGNTYLYQMIGGLAKIILAERGKYTLEEMTEMLAKA